MGTGLPQSRQLIPQFTLATRSGEEVRISRYQGRRNLLLIFVPSRSIELVRELADRQVELEEENTQVLIVTQSQAAASSLKAFKVLQDPGGKVSERFGARNAPAVYITDQYGEIYSEFRSEEETPIPDADEVLASLRHINAACPE